MGLIIGGLWLLCAAFCFLAKNKKTELASTRIRRLTFCVFFSVFGIIGVAGFVLKNNLLSLATVLLATGLLCIWAMIYSVKQSQQCNHAISAMYTGFNTYSSMFQKTYCPIFEYDYEGVHYNRQSMERYSYKKLKKHFQIRDRLYIYINPDAPENCISTQKVSDGYALCGILGVALILLFIVSLF